MKNCDVRDVLKPEDKQGELLYGKRVLKSHMNYDLWDGGDTFNTKEIERLYRLFVMNMEIMATCFKTKWVRPELLLPTTKDLIWQWTDDEEKMQTAMDILVNGMYFPIFTLERGQVHNQIASEKELEMLRAKNLYNSYNGNHRIDVIHYWQSRGEWSRDVLIYIIPEFCQKSCTGFKYTPIDDHDSENPLVQKKLPHPIRVFHLNRLEHEMKVTNWREEDSVSPGISLVKVDNYNVAFRIMTEFQNALEVPLTQFYKKTGRLPEGVLEESRYFNEKEVFCRGIKRTNLYPGQ